MYGAVFGDIIGSHYEWHNVKSEDFELFPRDARFTDDTVLTVAIAEAILNMGDNHPGKCYAQHIKAYYNRYPDAGFGTMFRKWAGSSSLQIQHSFFAMIPYLLFSLPRRPEFRSAVRWCIPRRPP